MKTQYQQDTRRKRRKKYSLHMTLHMRISPHVIVSPVLVLIHLQSYHNMTVEDDCYVDDMMV